MPGPFNQFLFRRFKKAENARHELSYLFWECTTRCNLQCLHCGSDCSSESAYPDMPLEDFLVALDTIESPPEHMVVAITGGEPLLRSDLESCGREIRKRGIRWGMVTNGQLYSPERHNALLNAGMGSLTISLDGLERTHNWLRDTRSSYQQVDEAIALAASSPRLNFDVVTCVHRRNLTELTDLHNYLVLKGVKAWRLFTITPIGRARAHPDLFLSNSGFRQLMEFIVEKRREYILDVKFSCEGYVGPYEPLVRDTPFFCRAGINIGSILIDGSISACPNIDRALVQGNIYRDNFFEIWNNRFQVFRQREWTRKGRCVSCSEYRNCQGNGMHYWHGAMNNVLVCHNAMINTVS